MNIIYKTPEAENRHIAYETSGNKITLGDDELTLNLSKYEQDDLKHIDICFDATGCLVVGTATGRKYVAEIDIPARRYTEEASGEETTREPVDFDINLCTLTLWAVD
jgi:hypothetical protein